MYTVPVLYLCVFPFVFWRRLCFSGGLTSEFKAFFHRTEEFARDVINILQCGDNVGRTGNGLKDLDTFQRVGDAVDSLQSIAVAKKNLDPIIDISKVY